MEFGDAKLKHLEMLQGVINRMAANSFHLKGWSVVLVSAFFALAASGADTRFAFLALFPAIAFWVLDGFFLWQERLFRGLYDHVRALADADITFSMDTSVSKASVESWFDVTFSRTLSIFHGAVCGAVVIVILILAYTL